METLTEFVNFAAEVAERVRPISLKYFRTISEVDVKADGSPVTIADRECELAVRKMVSDTYPSHGIMGEELGGNAFGKHFTWLVDPIDGTKAFIAGAPTYGTLLALLQRGVPVLGVIDIPALDERWIAAKQKPTTMNGHRVWTRSCTELAKTILTVISPEKFEAADQAALRHLTGSSGVCRYTSDGYAYGLLASGYIDLVVASNQQFFDYLPVVNVIEQAGGRISDWSGNALELESDGRVIASANQQLHEQALEDLQT